MRGVRLNKLHFVATGCLYPASPGFLAPAGTRPSRRAAHSLHGPRYIHDTPCHLACQYNDVPRPLVK